MNDLYILFKSLTKRETEVALLVGQGYTNTYISTNLELTLKAVENYTHSIFQTLQLNSENTYDYNSRVYLSVIINYSKKKDLIELIRSSKMQYFACVDCGPCIKVDEDACCTTCGADSLILDFNKNLSNENG